MAIFLYQSRRNELESELEVYVDRLEEQYNAEVSHNRISAVAGELGGDAIRILLSDEVQAFTTAVEIGAVVWSLIEADRALGRHFDIGKNESKVLAAHEANGKLDQGHGSASEGLSPFIWGPMEAVPQSGISSDGEVFARLFQIAVVLPWRRDRARTYWYLINKKGDISASWYTQTLRDRLPGFLNPENQSS